MAIRIDRATLMDSKAVMTKQGYLRAPATFTRVGVFPYRMADGKIRREYRPPEEVFRAETLESLKGIPFTDDHPAKLLDASDTKNHILGYTGEVVEVADDHVHGTLTIYDKGLIEKVQSGKRQVSCGYTADHEEKPGVWNGLEYDVIQRNIVYNHISSVTTGRAGPTVRIRLDGDDAEICDENEIENPKGSVMEKMTIDGVEVEVTPAAKSEIEKALAKRDAEITAKASEVTAVKKDAADKAADFDAKQAKIDALTEEVTGLKTKMDAAPIMDSEEQFKTRYVARRAIEKTAEVVLNKETIEKMDTLGNLDLMKAVVKEKTGADVAEKSEHYVQARFDHITETLEADIKAKHTLNSSFSQRFDSDKEGKVAAARAKSTEDSRNAWKQ